MAKGADENNACFLNAQMKFSQGFFTEAYTASENCIAASALPYPNLYGLKAYAAYKINDSVNAKAAFDLYLQKQKSAKITSRDYETYARLLLKFLGNEALAGSFIDKAVELDSTETGKVVLLKSIASTYGARLQYVAAADWYKKIVSDEIIIYNSIGQIVSNVNKPENNSLSLLNIEKGTYYIVFLKEKKRILTKKIIKE